MTRFTRNTLALLFGFVIGAFFTFAHAQIVYTNRDGIIIRDSAGRVSTINLPRDPLSLGEQSLLDSMDRDKLTLKDSGNWDVQDKNGSKVSIPGKQKLTLPGGGLAKAAGAAAMLAKGAVGGAIVGLLIQEGIKLAGDQWVKEQPSDIPPDLYYEYIPPGSTKNVYTADLNTATTGWCQYVANNSGMPFQSVKNVSFDSAASQVKFDCALSGYTFSDMRMNARKLCQGMIPPVNGSCGTQSTERPATEKDLQDALDKRRQMMDDALRDYYNAISPEKRNELGKNEGTIDASGTPTPGPAKTSTTTKPDGTTQTTTTTTINNITHQGNTFNTSVVSVVSNSTTSVTENGQTTTTTEVADVGIKEPDKTDCEKSPNSIGCSEFGSVDDSELERKELTGTVTPIDMGGSGQCPAPLSSTVLGQHIEFSFDPACRFAGAMRPIVLVLAWLAAAYILSGAVRGST